MFFYMDIYLAYQLHTKDDIIVAFLSELGFESFVEEDDHMVAYINKNLHTKKNEEEILKVLHHYQVDYNSEEIQPQNWNALWESSFQPVRVGDFCLVRADFHPKDENIKHDLIINPKMAFGTGHHATTHMMITAMKEINVENKTVFDYGAGTGILAILASKMGASDTDAIDIELESYHNMIENNEVNHVFNVNPLHGTLDNIDINKVYDVILANINRNILLRSAEKLYALLKPGGIILLSGILKEDMEMVENAYVEIGMLKTDFLEENQWACIQFIKN
ncbi:MAG: 50S ribosomal protein L11 methyltransferase [Saprospiraceae bacterium]|nr:50S ribosomal protein L11 methyltransferase [Saprospiraceae bacterium]